MTTHIPYGGPVRGPRPPILDNPYRTRAARPAARTRTLRAVGGAAAAVGAFTVGAMTAAGGTAAAESVDGAGPVVHAAGKQEPPDGPAAGRTPSSGTVTAGGESGTAGDGESGTARDGEIGTTAADEFGTAADGGLGAAGDGFDTVGGGIGTTDDGLRVAGGALDTAGDELDTAGSGFGTGDGDEFGTDPDTAAELWSAADGPAPQPDAAARAATYDGTPWDPDDDTVTPDREAPPVEPVRSEDPDRPAPDPTGSGTTGRRGMAGDATGDPDPVEGGLARDALVGDAEPWPTDRPADGTTADAARAAANAAGVAVQQPSGTSGRAVGPAPAPRPASVVTGQEGPDGTARPEPAARSGLDVPGADAGSAREGWPWRWPAVGNGQERTLHLRSDTGLGHLTRKPDPVRIGLLDHLAGEEGARALQNLRSSTYPITSDEDWYRAVGDVANRLRLLAIGSSPVSADRARGAYPIHPEEPRSASGRRALQGSPTRFNRANAEAQLRLAGGGATGLLAPEMGCWLVCDADGTARVLDTVSIGTESNMGFAWSSDRSPYRLRGASRLDYIHLHPFVGNTAGLSHKPGDLGAAQTLAQWLSGQNLSAEVGMTSIDALTGTVTRGVPGTHAWSKVQVLPGGAGPAIDRINVAEIWHDTASPHIERPLPLDIAAGGTADVLDAIAYGARPSPDDLAAQELHAAQLAEFDALLAQRTPSPDAPTTPPVRPPSPDVPARVGPAGPRAPSPVAVAPDAPRAVTGLGAALASVAAPFVEQGLRRAGALPADPLRQGWGPQALNVAARTATGCVTGLTSRAECALGAVAEGSKAFFDQTTLGRRVREFAETEHDGNPVRERAEAAASVPINVVRQVGSVSGVAGSAFETTGQAIGTGLAYGWDVLDGGHRMPVGDYLRNLDEMSGPGATRAGLRDLWETQGRIDGRRMQVLTGVRPRRPGSPTPSAEATAPACAAGGRCASAAGGGSPPPRPAPRTGGTAGGRGGGPASPALAAGAPRTATAPSPAQPARRPAPAPRGGQGVTGSAPRPADTSAPRRTRPTAPAPQPRRSGAARLVEGATRQVGGLLDRAGRTVRQLWSGRPGAVRAKPAAAATSGGRRGGGR